MAVEVQDVGSGATTRPQREKLIEPARRREIDFVPVWRLDRWGRSLVDLVNTLQELNALDVGFVSLCEALDLTTPSGRALAAEAGDGQGPARTRASARPPPRRGDRSGASIASEPAKANGHMAQLKNRSPVGGGKPDGGMATGDGAHLEPDCYGPARGEGRCRIDSCRSERCWATSFISAGSLAKVSTRISGGYPPLVCRVCSGLIVSGLLPQ